MTKEEALEIANSLHAYVRGDKVVVVSEGEPCDLSKFGISYKYKIVQRTYAIVVNKENKYIVTEDDVSLIPDGYVLVKGGFFSEWEATKVMREMLSEYAPYSTLEEMCADYCKRYSIIERPHYRPLIWVRNKEYPKAEYLITKYLDDAANVDGNFISLKELSEKFEYLDGQRIGRKINYETEQ